MWVMPDDGLVEVYDSSPLSVHSNGLGEHTGTFAAPRVERIELAFQVAVNRGRINAYVRVVHLHRLERFAALSVGIDAQGDGLGILRCEQPERGLRGRIFHFVDKIQRRRTYLLTGHRRRYVGFGNNALRHDLLSGGKREQACEQKVCNLHIGHYFSVT